MMLGPSDDMIFARTDWTTTQGTNRSAWCLERQGFDPTVGDALFDFNLAGNSGALCIILLRVVKVLWKHRYGIRYQDNCGTIISFFIGYLTNGVCLIGDTQVSSYVYTS